MTKKRLIVLRLAVFIALAVFFAQFVSADSCCAINAPYPEFGVCQPWPGMTDVECCPSNPIGQGWSYGSYGFPTSQAQCISDYFADNVDQCLYSSSNTDAPVKCEWVCCCSDTVSGADMWRSECEQYSNSDAYPAGQCPVNCQIDTFCSDGVDNDQDNKIDNADPGCWDDPTDSSTYNETRTSEVEPQCYDGQDNDGDGDIDYPADSGCNSPWDTNEIGPENQCSGNDCHATDYPKRCDGSQWIYDCACCPADTTCVASGEIMTCVSDDVTCPNGVLDEGEDCDSGLFRVGSNSCSALDPNLEGTLSCFSNCSYNNASCYERDWGCVEGRKPFYRDPTGRTVQNCSECGCPESAVPGLPNYNFGGVPACKPDNTCNFCGNGNVDFGEYCDPNAPKVRCDSLEGFGTGTSEFADCTAQCTLDTTPCIRTCYPNGVLAPTESCDDIDVQNPSSLSYQNCKDRLYGECTANIGCTYCSCVGELDCNLCGGTPDYDKYCVTCPVQDQCDLPGCSIACLTDPRCEDPDCNCEDCGCYTNCEERSCCQQLGCMDACSATNIELICDDGGDNDGDLATDCGDYDCSGQPCGSECVNPNAIDTNNDNVLDTCCYGGIATTCGIGAIVPNTCGVCECESDPAGITLTLTDVNSFRMEEKLEVEWTIDCNVEFFQVFRCDAGDPSSTCDPNELIEPNVPNSDRSYVDEFTFNGVDYRYETNYCYQVKGYFTAPPVTIESGVVCVYSGDEYCFHSAASGYFCIKGNDVDPDGNPFTIDSVYRCYENNTLKEVDDCTLYTPYRTCFDDGSGEARCLYQSPCDKCNGVFNVFADPTKLVAYDEVPGNPNPLMAPCEDLYTCFIDRSVFNHIQSGYGGSGGVRYSNVDMFRSCSNVNRCSDYKGPDACEDSGVGEAYNNRCLSYNCTWHSTNLWDLGVGVCIPQNPEDEECLPCDETGLIPCDEDYCELTNCATNSNPNDPECVDISETTCEAYGNDMESCLGGGVDAEVNVIWSGGVKSGGDNALTPSNDRYEIGVCKFGLRFGSPVEECWKDADDDDVWDQEYLTDTTPPVSTMSPQMPYFIVDDLFNLWESFNMEYSTTDIGRNNLPGSGLGYFSVCLAPRGEYCYPGYEEDSYMDYVIEAVPSGVLGFSPSDFSGQGEYSLFYYAEDLGHNLEQVKRFDFAYVPAPVANFTVTHEVIPDPSSEGTDSEILVHIASDELLRNCKEQLDGPNGRVATTTSIPSSIRDYTIQYKGLVDGTYAHILNCTDPYGNSLTNVIDPIIVSANGDSFGALPYGTIDFTTFNLSVYTKKDANCQFALMHPDGSQFASGFEDFDNKYNTGGENYLHVTRMDTLEDYINSLGSGANAYKANPDQRYNFYYECEMVETGVVRRSNIMFTVDRIAPTATAQHHPFFKAINWSIWYTDTSGVPVKFDVRDYPENQGFLINSSASLYCSWAKTAACVPNKVIPTGHVTFYTTQNLCYQAAENYKWHEVYSPMQSRILGGQNVNYCHIFLIDSVVPRVLIPPQLSVVGPNEVTSRVQGRILDVAYYEPGAQTIDSTKNFSIKYGKSNSQPYDGTLYDLADFNLVTLVKDIEFNSSGSIMFTFRSNQGNYYAAALEYEGSGQYEFRFVRKQNTSDILIPLAGGRTSVRFTQDEILAYPEHTLEIRADGTSLWASFAGKEITATDAALQSGNVRFVRDYNGKATVREIYVIDYFKPIANSYSMYKVGDPASTRIGYTDEHFSEVFSLSNGVNQFVINASDIAGNWAVYRFNITKDNVGPNISAQIWGETIDSMSIRVDNDAPSPGHAELNHPVSFVVTARDDFWTQNVNRVSLRLTCTSCTPNRVTGPFDMQRNGTYDTFVYQITQSLDPGSYVARYEAWDSFGNSRTYEQTFSISDSIPPNIILDIQYNGVSVNRLSRSEDPRRLYTVVITSDESLRDINGTFFLNGQEVATLRSVVNINYVSGSTYRYVGTLEIPMGNGTYDPYDVDEAPATLRVFARDVNYALGTNTLGFIVDTQCAESLEFYNNQEWLFGDPYITTQSSLGVYGFTEPSYGVNLISSVDNRTWSSFYTATAAPDPVCSIDRRLPMQMYGIGDSLIVFQQTSTAFNPGDYLAVDNKPWHRPSYQYYRIQSKTPSPPVSTEITINPALENPLETGDDLISCNQAFPGGWFGTTLRLNEGEIKIRGLAEDDIGNICSAYSSTFRIVSDQHPPAITVISPNNGAIIGKNNTNITVYLYDALSGIDATSIDVDIYHDGVPYDSVSCGSTLQCIEDDATEKGYTLIYKRGSSSQFSDGVYIVNVSVMDKAGWRTSRQFSFEINQDVPTIIDMEVTPGFNWPDGWYTSSTRPSVLVTYECESSSGEPSTPPPTFGIFRTVDPLGGNQYRITLDVKVQPGSLFYVIEEIPDMPMTIVDSGVFDVDSNNHLKYVQLSNPVDTQLTFIVSSSVPPTFSGIYQFDDMSSDALIMDVSSPSSPSSDGEIEVVSAEVLFHIATVSVSYVNDPPCSVRLAFSEALTPNMRHNFRLTTRQRLVRNGVEFWSEAGVEDRGFYIDTNPPSILLENIPVTNDENIHVYGEFSDDPNNMAYLELTSSLLVGSRNLTLTTSGTISEAVTLDYAGDGSVTVTAIDKAGNRDADTRVIDYDIDGPIISGVDVFTYYMYEDNINDRLIVNNQSIIVSGRVSEPSTVYINVTNLDDTPVPGAYYDTNHTQTSNSFELQLVMKTMDDFSNHSLRIVAYDEAGNPSAAYEMIITYDDRGPVIEFTNPPAPNYLDGRVEPHFTNDDTPELRFMTNMPSRCSIDTGAYSGPITMSQEGRVHTYQYPLGVPRQENVVYQFAVNCYSAALNSEGSLSSSFVVDLTPPSLMFEALTGNVHENESGNYQIFEMTDNHNGELQTHLSVYDSYRVAGYDNALICTTYQCTGVPDNSLCSVINPWGNDTYPLNAQAERLIYLSTAYNEYTYLVDCVDRAGNPASATTTLRVDVHRTYEILSIEPEYADTSTPTISVRTNMATQFCEISVDGEMTRETPTDADLQIIKRTIVNSLLDGTHQIHVSCLPYHSYANEQQKTLTMHVDTVGPEITSVTHTRQNDAFLLRWTASDPNPGTGVVNYSYVIDTRATTSPAERVNMDNTSMIVELSDGDYYFHVRALDRAGNWGDPLHYMLSIDTSPPERVEMLLSPNPARSGSTITVSGVVYKSGAIPDHNATVDIYVDDQYDHTLTASEGGIFSTEIVDISGDSKIVKAIASDIYGNGPTNVSEYLKIVSMGPAFSHMLPPDGTITSVVDSVAVYLDKVDDAEIDLMGSSLTVVSSSGNEIEGTIARAYTDGTHEHVVLTFTPLSDLPADEYTVSIETSDVLGNAESYEKGFELDPDALKLTLTPAYDGPVFTTQQRWTFNGVLTGNIAASTGTLYVDNNDESYPVTLDVATQSFSVTVDLAEQENRLEFRFVDVYGGQASSGYLFYIYDSIDPMITITRPQNGILTAEPSTTMFDGVSGTYQEHYYTYNGFDRIDSLENIRVFRGGTEVAYVESPYDNQFLVNFDLREGLNQVEVVGTDKVGRTGRDFVNITLDTTAPSITITNIDVDPEFIKYQDGNIIRTNADRFIIRGTYSDNNMNKVYVKGSNQLAVLSPAGTFSINITTGMPNQEINVTLVAEDQTGQKGEDSFVYVLDRTGPNVLSIQPESTNTQTPRVWMHLDEHTAECSVTYLSELDLEFTDQATRVSDNNFTVQLSEYIKNNDGTDLTMDCKDPLDNEKRTVKPIIVDNVAPTILDLTIAEGGADLTNASPGMNEYIVYSGGTYQGRRVAVIKLKAEADEPVRCRYSTGTINYDEMDEEFDGFYDFMFAPITDNIILDDNTTTVIHASCEDRAENVAINHYSIKIKVDLGREVRVMDPLPDEYTTSTDVELSVKTIPEANCRIDRGSIPDYNGQAFETPFVVGQTSMGKDIYMSTFPMSLNVGQYSFDVVCSDPEDVFLDGRTTISFRIIPEFDLEVVSPRHGWASTEIFDIHMRSSRSADCKYDLEPGPYRYLNFNFTSNNGLDHYLYNKTAGNMYVSCVDEYGYEMPTRLYAFNFDRNKPTIQQAYAFPNPVNYLIDNTLQTTIFVDTDKQTVCKYSFNEQNYSAMQTFFTNNDPDDAGTFTTKHSVALLDLDDRVEYMVYVACENLPGTVSDLSTVHFVTDRTAQLSLSIIEPRNNLVTGETTTQIRAITNKPATCYYGTENSAINSVFSSTGGTNHSTDTINNIPEGEHTFYVKCKSTTYEVEGSTTIVVDLTPPTTPIINDTYNTCYLTWLKASWLSVEDTHERTYVDTYYYAIGSQSGSSDIVDWRSAGDDTLVTRTGLTLENGKTYYWSVIAENNAGRNSSRGTSPGVKMDNTTCPSTDPPSCYDNIKNQAETDVDCGGPCTPCGDDRDCDVDADCVSGNCDPTTHTCEAPLCSNLAEDEDNGETDVDCGGTTCEACANNLKCEEDTDCISGWCDSGVCHSASCTDGVKNGKEGDIDCGGTCPDQCGIGDECRDHEDCASGVCGIDDTCTAPTCDDDLQTDGYDSDYDCGGQCPPCGIGDRCIDGSDCKSGNCENNECTEKDTDTGDDFIDEDNDDMDDNWEIENGLDPTVDDSWKDPDGDLLTNLEESKLKTNPNAQDSDGDDFGDGEEVNEGYDPLDRFDYPGAYDDESGSGGSFWTYFIIVMIVIILGVGGYYGYEEYVRRNQPKRPLGPGGRVMPPGTRPGGLRGSGPRPLQRVMNPAMAAAAQAKRRFMDTLMQQKRKQKLAEREKTFKAFDDKFKGPLSKKQDQAASAGTTTAASQTKVESKPQTAQVSGSAEQRHAPDWIPLKADKTKVADAKAAPESKDTMEKLASISKGTSKDKKRDVFAELDKLSNKPKIEKAEKKVDVFEKLSTKTGDAAKKKPEEAKPKTIPKIEIVDEPIEPEKPIKQKAEPEKRTPVKKSTTSSKKTAKPAKRKGS